MNVYIGTSGELKNAYIGEVLHISSDLRGATLAGLQAQGWDGIAYRYNQYTLNSSGLTPSKSSNNDVAFLYKNIPDLSSNNIITCRITGNLTRVSSELSCSLGYMSSSSISFPTAFGSELRCHYLSANNSNNKNGIVYNDSTQLGTAPSSTTGGNFDLTTKINLSTGLVEYTLTSPISFTTSATLSSSQLTNVLTYKNIGALAQIFSTSNTATIYTVDLTIEY